MNSSMTNSPLVQPLYIFPRHSVLYKCYLEAKNYGPDETKGETWVAVNNVMSSHVLQMNSLLIEKCQRLVNVLQTVNPHLALRRIRLHTLRPSTNSVSTKKLGWHKSMKLTIFTGLILLLSYWCAAKSAQPSITLK